MKNQDLITELKKSGVRVAEYKRPPFGSDVFALTIRSNHPEGTVTVNQGTAAVEVHGNKRLRQAAVTVRERGRTIVRKVSRTHFLHRRPHEDAKLVKTLLRRDFPVLVPKGTRWDFSDIEVKRIKQPENYSNPLFKIRGKVTAKVINRTVNHFLIGMDETHHFIAPLAHHVNSVKEAHEILKPEGIKRGTVRQGEWFFIPCGREETRMLTAILHNNARRVTQWKLSGTTHIAKSAIRIMKRRKAIIFARGYIVDNRQGHHRSLFLPKWHKVVKNKEAKIKVSSDQRARAHSTQQIWD